MSSTHSAPIFFSDKKVYNMTKTWSRLQRRRAAEVGDDDTDASNPSAKKYFLNLLRVKLRLRVAS